MMAKTTRTEFKAQLRQMDEDDLNALLEEKRRENAKEVREARKFGYTPTQLHKFRGNIRRSRRQIAIILQIMQEKGYAEHNPEH